MSDSTYPSTETTNSEEMVYYETPPEETEYNETTSLDDGTTLDPQRRLRRLILSLIPIQVVQTPTIPLTTPLPPSAAQLTPVARWNCLPTAYR